jgi:hypothetical protein
VKLNREGIREVAPEPNMRARAKTNNPFLLNKSISKNRTCMRGFRKSKRLVGQPTQARGVPYNMGYCSESRTLVYLPEA